VPLGIVHHDLGKVEVDDDAHDEPDKYQQRADNEYGFDIIVGAQLERCVGDDREQTEPPEDPPRNESHPGVQGYHAIVHDHPDGTCPPWEVRQE